MESHHDIFTLRLAHLRACSACKRGWYHVAVQNYLYCFEQMSESGDTKATAFFAAQLAQTYHAMGMDDKAHKFTLYG